MTKNAPESGKNIQSHLHNESLVKFSISKDQRDCSHLKTGSVLLFWPKKFSITAIPVVKPNVGKMSTMIQRYQKLLIMMEWFSVDLFSFTFDKFFK